MSRGRVADEGEVCETRRDSGGFGSGDPCLAGAAGMSLIRQCCRMKRATKEFFETSGDYHFATSDSQSCITTRAELSPGVIDGITKRLPSAETSNETTE